MPAARAPSGESMLESLAGGVRFVWSQPVVLGALALDLFSVLFGGATALLPVFADEILHVGPEGLGLLRAAPAAGAVVTSLWLAHRPPLRRAGRTLLVNVALFGVAMIVFGLSRSFALSLGALVVSGMVDTVSVVVRSTLLQVLTPGASAGTGLVGQRHFHRQLQRDRRVRVGRRGQAAGHGAVGGPRRARDADGRGGDGGARAGAAAVAGDSVGGPIRLRGDTTKGAPTSERPFVACAQPATSPTPPTAPVRPCGFPPGA